MHIRLEEPRDRAAVRAVNIAAFGTSAEADIVDALRARSKATISLVAELADRLVGHIMFSPVGLSGHPELEILGLGPMSVVPEHQRQGIGSALALAGLERCRELDCAAVVVVGHAEYYPRFGFVPGARYGLRCEYDVPEEVFMVLELKPGALRDASGVVCYDVAFGGP